MELKFNIPDYFSIKDWKYFNSLEMESDNDKMIKFLSYITDIQEDKILELTPIALRKAYSTVLETIGEAQASFYPIIEIDDQLYGYSSLSKMTLGEYIDLERLAKNPIKNLEEIMAIVYRPIKKHKLDGVVWAFKNKYKTGTGNVENLFKYYTLEKYDNLKTTERATLMNTLPVSFALGAMGFFLVQANISLLSTQVYSIPNLNKKETKTMINKVKESVSMPIGDGLLQFITFQKLPSFQSQETSLSLT
jgi:hypothetical protein